MNCPVCGYDDEKTEGISEVVAVDSNKEKPSKKKKKKSCGGGKSKTRWVFLPANTGVVGLCFSAFSLAFILTDELFLFGLVSWFLGFVFSAAALTSKSRFFGMMGLLLCVGIFIIAIAYLIWLAVVSSTITHYPPLYCN